MHKFTVQFPEGVTATEIIQTIKKNIKGFSGDEKYGSFNESGLVGSYEVNGTDIAITLTRKPFFVTWKYIESEIRSHFAVLGSQ